MGADVSVVIAVGSELRTRQQLRGIIPVFSKAERIFFLVYVACLAVRRSLKLLVWLNIIEMTYGRKVPL